MERFIRSAYADTWPREKIMDYLQSIIAANAVADGLREELDALRAAKCMICGQETPRKDLPKKQYVMTVTLGPCWTGRSGRSATSCPVPGARWIPCTAQTLSTRDTAIPAWSMPSGNIWTADRRSAAGKRKTWPWTTDA